MSCYVFLGPTLPVAEAAALLDAVYLPPVRQSDVLRLVRSARPRAIGIVDGYFRDVPACWHKEILFALAEGVHVFGAASMGALRAAELDGLGMVGVGRVYEAYRSGTFQPYGPEPFEDDDEVAVVHGPAETGYVALSEAMVNMRATFAHAAEQGVIDAGTRDALVAVGKVLFYPERSYAAVLGAGRAQGLDAEAITRLELWLPASRVDVKQSDARAMLARMGDLLARDPVPFAAAFRLEASSAWRDAVAATDHAAREEGGLDELVLDEVRLHPTAADGLLRRAVERLAALVAADRRGMQLDAAAERRAAEAIRAARGLMRQRDLETWCRGLDLPGDGLARLVADEARLLALTEVEAPAARGCLLDLLRLDGGYSPLRDRALAKRDALAGLEMPQLADADVRQLVCWHALLGEEPAPADADVYAQALGFADSADLARALWRERTWRDRAAAGTPGHESFGEALPSQ